MNTYLSKGNKKYKIPGMRVRTFGLPAYKARDGSLMCPGAGKCKLGCYAKQGHYYFNNVTRAQERRLKLTRDPGLFVATIVQEVHRMKLNWVRVHDSGDFYSLEYAKLWKAVALACPQTWFLAYSKMVPMLHKLMLVPGWPGNLVVVFSEGGRWDDGIHQDRDKFARIFPSLAALKRAGFTDCHITDRPALNPKVRKIGLVYHGFESRKFVTAKESQ